MRKLFMLFSLALVMLLSPSIFAQKKNTESVIKCTVVNTARQSKEYGFVYAVACNDPSEARELEIPYGEWPAVWGDGPMLGYAYSAAYINGMFTALQLTDEQIKEIVNLRVAARLRMERIRCEMGAHNCRPVEKP